MDNDKIRNLADRFEKHYSEHQFQEFCHLHKLLPVEKLYLFEELLRRIEAHREVPSMVSNIF